MILLYILHYLLWVLAFSAATATVGWMLICIWSHGYNTALDEELRLRDLQDEANEKKEQYYNRFIEL